MESKIRSWQKNPRIRTGKISKSLLLILLILFTAALHGADYVKLEQEAKKAARARNHALAVSKYEAAFRAARNSAEKCNAVRGKFHAMRNLRKWKEAEQFMVGVIESDMLRPQELRLLLNVFSVTFMRSKRREYGLSLLQSAQNLPCPVTNNAFYKTYEYMAEYHILRKQPEAVIEIMDEILQITGIHPANLYSGNMLVGRIYEQFRKKEEALRHYKEALKHGKRVKYKFSVEKAEKAIERLSK